MTLTEKEALAAAREAEAAIRRGEYRGPLHGIPIGHKDLYWTRGVRTTAGSRVLEHFVPTEDATVVARYREAGAVMLGKLNTHEFAYGPTNEHSMFGPTRNPWGLDRTTGGSSGGETPRQRDLGQPHAPDVFGATYGRSEGGHKLLPVVLAFVGVRHTQDRLLGERLPRDLQSDRRMARVEATGYRDRG